MSLTKKNLKGDKTHRNCNHLQLYQIEMNLDEQIRRYQIYRDLK